MEILAAHQKEFLPALRGLFEAYAAEIQVDLCFQGFAAELAGLPGRYAPPRGRLFLAQRNDLRAGCVALRSLGDDACEMKRLYVCPALRGLGIGRDLATAAIEAARAIGYQRMRLDTLPTMQAAIALYRALGFQEISAYCQNPVPGALFMELALAQSRTAALSSPP